MVKIDLAGFPAIDIGGIPTEPGSAGRLKQRIRRNMKGQGGSSFKLSWTTTVPRLVLTSDTDEFDETIIQHFHEEGFQLAYLAYTGNHADYVARLQHLQDPLELGEKYAIVAYGDAAALVLEACMKPMPKLVGVIAYYPPYMPRTNTNFPPTLNVQIHLASSQKFGTRHPSYRYDHTHEGFAEHDLEEYDKVAARLAWSRDITLLHRSFDMPEYDLEAIRENHTRLEFEEKDAAKTLATMVSSQPYVNHVPTMTGGIGRDDLHRFYSEFFIPNNPPSMKIRLLSRTVGADRVVDEMLVKFTHTTEIPWMLPGVPPTEKRVEVVLVSVVSMRAGRLAHEHIHWDQASVLVQIGLLDPELIPKTFKTAEEGREKEVKRLPVCGKEAARKVVDEERYESNELIPGWSKE